MISKCCNAKTEIKRQFVPLDISEVYGIFHKENAACFYTLVSKYVCTKCKKELKSEDVEYEEK